MPSLPKPGRALLPLLVALAALAALAALPAAAQDAPRFASFTFENDFFAGYDRHFTNGMQLAWTATPRTVVAFGQRIYTPSNTDIEPPDPRDRPYAGWLYAMADTRLRAAPTIDHLTLVAGVIGPPALARQTQDAIHRLLHEPISKGWDHQERTRPTFMAQYERAWPRLLEATLHSREVDLALRAGATLGTPLTYADAGAVVRYGRNLPEDIPATHISLAPPRDGYRGTHEMGWYLWAGIDARALAYDAFIQAPTFGDASRVGREPFGYDAQWGVALAWPDARVGFSLVRRSKLFDRQQGPDRFGQLSVSLAY